LSTCWQVEVVAHERVERIPQHGLAMVAMRGCRSASDDLVRGIAACCLGDVHGQIADALEVVVDLEQRPR